MEKRLGKDETIFLDKNSIVAFSSSIEQKLTLEGISSEVFSTNKNLCLYKGPGLIIFSMTKKESSYNMTLIMYMIGLLLLCFLHLFDRTNIKR